MSLQSSSLAQRSFLKRWTTVSHSVVDYPSTTMDDDAASTPEDETDLEELEECFESPTKKLKRSNQECRSDSDDDEGAKISSSCMDMLSDEILLHIIMKFIPDAKTLARVSGTNQRCRKLLTEDRVVNQLVESRVDPKHRDLIVIANNTTGLSPFEELGFYQAVASKGLFEESRIGFDFASTDMDDDNGNASSIKDSISRINHVGSIMEQFDNASLIVEAHCGTAAPPGIAPGFSRARGQVVCSEVIHSDYDIPNLSERITMNPWGRRVAQRASASDHKHGIVAREGRGWVEVYLVLDGSFELPRRPSYYDGLRIDEEDEPVRVIRVLW